MARIDVQPPDTLSKQHFSFQDSLPHRPVQPQPLEYREAPTRGMRALPSYNPTSPHRRPPPDPLPSAPAPIPLAGDAREASPKAPPLAPPGVPPKEAAVMACEATPLDLDTSPRATYASPSALDSSMAPVPPPAPPVAAPPPAAPGALADRPAPADPPLLPLMAPSSAIWKAGLAAFTFSTTAPSAAIYEGTRVRGESMRANGRCTGALN